MDDKRRDLMVAGLYLGDVTLVLAAIDRDLPPYVEGFELERVIPEADDLEPARKEVESLLAGREEIEEIPPDLIRKILDTAIDKGKFCSASRCLGLLGERDAYVDRFIAGAGEKVKAGDVAGAARDITVASNLDSEAGFPLFQSLGPDLHADCPMTPEECLTRAAADEAVSRALEYLLEGEKVLAFVAGLGAGERKKLLPHVAQERDPNLREFYALFAGAHASLGEVESVDLEALGSDIKRAAGVASDLERYLRGASPAGDASAAALERARRMASGFVKDFENIDSLLKGLQLGRLKRRIGNMMESGSELKAAGQAIQGGDVGPLGQAVALIEEFGEKGIMEKIDETEAKLAGLQVALLGRPVHSQEHWQYLRELAFKYPVSPLMCCIRRLNDRYMVIPRWDSDLTVILKDFLEKA